MIYGIGIDAIELTRIKDILLANEIVFINKILTKKEIENCPDKIKRKTEYVAGRFAGKEAVAKALGTGFGSQLTWKDIEIVNNEAGKPVIKLENPNWNAKHLNYHISITHTNTLAIAKVIIEE